ncbi:putative xyloglucan glycosyltransferase 9 [Dendrobium catenatum]|uniref:Putative xyloglucan glycosyltransferase 9 n=1 Tax=Dendrobium catenatum TaxID=906689 RepID=A0A2I0VSJ0_9ASPA|nr:putative xyloglucan glycosyltransferase 9 [Dendrobium catenatum]
MQIALWKKMNLIFLFFLLRKFILPFYSFTLFCIVLPMTIFVPEAELPTWLICYVPAIMSFLKILRRSLFSSSPTSCLRIRRSKKSGRSSDGDPNHRHDLRSMKKAETDLLWKEPTKKKHNRIYRKELLLAFLLLALDRRRPQLARCSRDALLLLALSRCRLFGRWSRPDRRAD